MDERELFEKVCEPMDLRILFDKFPTLIRTPVSALRLINLYDEAKTHWDKLNSARRKRILTIGIKYDIFKE